MARFLSLIPLASLVFAASAAQGSWTEDALSAYRGFQKQISEARRTMSRQGDSRQLLVDLNVKRDALDAQFPYRPKESAALTAERRRTDVAFKSLTHSAKSVSRQTAGKAVPTSKKKKPKRK